MDDLRDWMEDHQEGLLGGLIGLVLGAGIMTLLEYLIGFIPTRR
mgnify:CR=1 FL=1